MIWVSWRQHRSQAMACLALLAALAVYAIVVGNSMRTAFGNDGLAGSCLARTQGAGCENGVQDFMGQFGSAINIAFWAVTLIVPGLIGVLTGGSLIARELEYGTWRLAWSQTVPRSRWLAVKLALVTGGLIVLGAAMTAVIMWYRAPMDALTGHLQHNAFDYEGLVLTAYILCAFGFAVLAGLLIRRSIPAMVAAFIPWLAIRLVIEFVARPHFMTPVTGPVIASCLPSHALGNVPCSYGVSSVPQSTGRIGDWVLSQNGPLATYQPANRFWALQGIEAGIFVALTAAALGATIWLLHRRATWTSLPKREKPASTLVPAVKAARSSTVSALADSPRPPRRRAALVALSARLPLPLLLGVRMAARRLRRGVLGAASIAVTSAGIVAVLAFRATVDHDLSGTSGQIGDPVVNRDTQMLLVITIVLVALAVLNAVCTAWATVLDSRRSTALARALGASPRQVTAGVAWAQVLPAVPGTLLGIPLGLWLFKVVDGGGTVTLPPAWWLAAAVVGSVAGVALLATAPARAGALRPAEAILQAETA